MHLTKYNVGNKKRLLVKVLTAIVLITIIVNQVVWLNNMYILHQRECKIDADQATQQAVSMELAERSEIVGGYSVYSHNITSPNDTSRFFTKNVVTEDSTYTFTIDKNDPNTMPKIVQFVLKTHLPLDLDKLCAIFKERMPEKYDVEDVYFDYLDLKNNLLIKTNKPEDISTTLYVRTDTIPLDIIDSIGVVGYIKNSQMTILNNMRTQLILSFLLIVIGFFSLFYISRSFIFQWKTEKMRQDSVNAMTHEFKRPISSAVAMVSVIPFYLEKKENEKVLDYVRSVEIDLNKLTQYTKRIQQISNNEKENVLLDKTDIDIVPFFETLPKRYGVSDENQRKIWVNLKVSTFAKTMYVDLLHFSNVMDNLVENAIKYTVKPTVTIDIHVTDTTDGLKVSVKDNGIGISSSDKKYIFDKFYRVKRKETKNKIGLGLGLTYVKSIIEAHGGDISVNSKLHEGSEFIILLKG